MPKDMVTNARPMNANTLLICVISVETRDQQYLLKQLFLSFASGTKSELSIIRRVVPSESDHKKNSVAAFGRLPHARIELKGVSSEERSTTFREKNYFMRFVSYDMWSFI